MTVTKFIPNQDYIDNLDLKNGYLSIIIMDEQQMSDDTSSDEEICDSLKTTWEEKQGTIPESPQATAVARSFSSAEANPVVERGSPKQKKLRIKKLPDSLKNDKSTQTDQDQKPSGTKKE